MKILVVEDDLPLRRLIVRGLESEAHEVDALSDGEEALALSRRRAYDLLIVDWMLPRLDGVSLTRTLRDGGLTTTIILVTAKGDVADRVSGLDSGADDYLTKPFHLEELLARVRAHGRRAPRETHEQRQVGCLQLDLIQHSATLGQRPLEVTAREFSLLEVLSRSPGKIYTRVQLLREVWEINFNPRTNVLDVYVNKLRAKLAEQADAPQIETIRSVGYRLSPGAAR